MLKRRFSLLGKLFVLALLAAALVACGSNISQANFEKVKVGMTMDEVKSVLGSPTNTSTMEMGGISGTTAIWSDNKNTISVQFMNGKVKFKQFTKSGG
jgi:hypothetical protein